MVYSLRDFQRHDFKNPSVRSQIMIFFFQINHAQVPKKSKLLFVLKWLGSICQCVIGGKRFSLTHRFQKSNGCALFLVCVGPTLYHGKGRKRSQSTFSLTGPSQSSPNRALLLPISYGIHPLSIINSSLFRLLTSFNFTILILISISFIF